MHYLGYNALKQKFAGKQFEILGFPCNQFNLQEPGDTATEILNTIKYVRPGNGYVPNFPMFAKVGVNGEDEHPLFTYLKKYCGPTADEFQDDLHYKPLRVSDVRWNFEQFVINQQGKPVVRFSPDVNPLNLTMVISSLLPHSAVDNMSNEIPMV